MNENYRKFAFSFYFNLFTLLNRVFFVTSIIFVAMKFGVHFLLLFFVVSLLPTFLNAAPKDCAVDGKCYPNGQNVVSSILSRSQSRSCFDGICYAYRCITHDGRVMHGSGCYEDFVNTCTAIQSNITEKAKGNKKYKYHDENVIVVSCGDKIDEPGCAQIKLQHYESRDVMMGFGKYHVKYDRECKYNNDPVPELPKVQCYKGGECFAGVLNISTKLFKFPNVTCNACTLFFCHQNGVTKVGTGCLEDFERICTNVPSDVMQKMKENKKNYYYADKNTILASCSFADNCQFAAMQIFEKSMPHGEQIIKDWKLKPSDKTCEYEPPVTVTPEPENGANGFELSVMIIFGFILFYLL